MSAKPGEENPGFLGSAPPGSEAWPPSPPRDQATGRRQVEGAGLGGPVAMETASTGDLDFDLLNSSVSTGSDLYTSLRSQQVAPYLFGDQKQVERVSSLDSHGGMFSSDSGIEMTPGESIDVARSLLESEKTETYSYMDVGQRDEHQQQLQHLGGWDDSVKTSSGQYQEKKAPETLGPVLDSYSFPYVEEPSDEELLDHLAESAGGTPRTISPVRITLTEMAPASGCPPQISVSERESILSLGVEGVPTVTLSEPEDDSPDSVTPPLTEESPSDLMFQSSVVKPVSSGVVNAFGASAQPLHSATVHDQDGSSAESGDSEIELVSDEPSPLHEQRSPGAGYASFGLMGGPASAVAPVAPPIQYSILREEREAELDSELVIESCDASSASEESPKREQDPAPAPTPALTTAPAPAPMPVEPPSYISREGPASDKIPSPSKMEGVYPCRPQAPPSVAFLEPQVERQPLKEKEEAEEGRKRPAGEGRGESERHHTLPLFLQGLNKQKAMDLLYWRDVKQTAVLFASVLLLLFSLTQFSVVSVMAYMALAALSATISFRVYKCVLQAVQKTDEGHPFKSYLETEIALSQDQIQKYTDCTQLYMNSAMKELRRLFLVQDLVDSLKFAVLMWLLTYVGALFNGLTLLILVVISMFTMPVVYEKYQAQIDQYLGLIRTHVNSVVGKIQEKIPGTKRKTE
ncbi:reticulon-1a isoform X1 [Paramormyrops kingsleyae]|uniref:reticulon-1a isoform X1 n=1 Tax=Paramormyrops kingsleyae TaxID=1676925 RepID=UPI003B96BEA4